MPNAHSVCVVAGSNAAGKTTFAGEYLPHSAESRESMDAGSIASGGIEVPPGEDFLDRLWGGEIV